MEFEDGQEINLTAVLHKDLTISEPTFSIYIKELADWVDGKYTLKELKECLYKDYRIEQMLLRLSDELNTMQTKLKEVNDLYEQQNQ